MAKSFWKKGTDTLHNGVVMGGLLGAAVAWGDTVLAKVEDVIPAGLATVLGEYTIPIYLIAAGALLGYAVDRY